MKTFKNDVDRQDLPLKEKAERILSLMNTAAEEKGIVLTLRK